MAKQTLVFESPMELSLRDGMIVITDRSTEKTSLRSLEDIQLVMIDHHSVRISVPLVIEFSKYNSAVVFCDEKHMPVSMLMDLDSNVLQSKHFRFQLAASKPMKKQIWKQIVEAKIRNQSKLLERLGIGKSLLSPYYINVKSGDSTNREGVAARVYWTKLMGKDFIRDRYGAPPNNMLNYGYALLRSMMARNLMNAGLLPSVGIFHHNYYDAFPLADDMMEPYRPYVDYRVKMLNDQGMTEVCRESKKALLDLFYEDIPSNSMLMSATSLVRVFEGVGNAVVFPNF